LCSFESFYYEDSNVNPWIAILYDLVTSQCLSFSSETYLKSDKLNSEGMDDCAKFLLF